MNRFLACIVATGSFFAYQAHGQSPSAGTVSATRGVEAVAESEQPRHGHHYVVAIGVDHYQYWPVLGTAVSDATGFGQLLTSRFGYEYAAAPLTESNATRDNIDSLVNDDLRNKLKPEDDLILFFAGHGTTRNDRIGAQTQSVGFLVPYEARAAGTNEHWTDYVSIEEFLRNVSTLPAEHILVILDSCHSGIALGSKFSPSRGDERFQADLLQKVSRTVITSAGSDQSATDVGPVPGHSLFTGLMIQGLVTGKADTFGQGFITATQLGAYAQHEVGVAAGSKQTPRFGGFDLDDGGELIIPLAASPSAGVRASAGASSSSAEGEGFAPTHEVMHAVDISKGKMMYQEPFTLQQAMAVARYFDNLDDFDDASGRIALRKVAGVTEVSVTLTDDDSVKSLADGSSDSEYIWQGREIAPLVGGLPIKVRLISKTGQTLRELAAMPFVGVYGRVIDASGAPIPGAKVTVRGETETEGLAWAVVSSSTGRFEFSDLDAGKYGLDAVAPGFCNYRQAGIAVDGHGNTKEDVMMKIGACK